LSATAAHAGGAVILLDNSIPQYQETARAARTRISGDVVTIDLAAQEDALVQARRQNPRVVVAVGQRALTAALARLPQTPIVYCTVLYPERQGGRGDTITGVPLEVPALAQLERLQKVAPKAKRLGVIYGRDSGALVEEASEAARKLGLHLVAHVVSSPREVADALDELAGRIDALWLLPDTRVVNKDVFTYLLRTTLDRGIPLFGFLEGFTQAGALASISPDYRDIGMRAGDLAAQILSRGVVPPKSYSLGALSINLKTAQRLGIEIDDRVKSSAHIFR
jgi:putative ABC transport system substrate-binding protein